jgi:hypothetical protein
MLIQDEQMVSMGNKKMDQTDVYKINVDTVDDTHNGDRHELDHEGLKLEFHIILRILYLVTRFDNIRFDTTYYITIVTKIYFSN